MRVQSIPAHAGVAPLEGVSAIEELVAELAEPLQHGVSNPFIRQLACRFREAAIAGGGRQAMLVLNRLL